MRKLIVLLLVFFMLAIVSPLFAGGGRQRDGVRVFRMADNQVDGYPTVLGNLAMAEYIYRETNGRIRIDVFNNAVLGEERATLEQTQTGAIHFIRISLTLLAAANPRANAFAMPFLFRDSEHLFRVLDGPLGQEMLESFQPQRLLGLAWYDAGFRSIYNSVREIRTPADLAGLRIRTQESALMMDMMRMLGAQPVPMAFGEVYTAIQNRVIDGAENNWPSFITTAHYEVARFKTVNRHMTSPCLVLVNTGVWNSFSPEEQAIVRRGAAEGARVARAAWIEADRRYEARARAAGVTITELTPAEFQLFVDALMPLYEQPEYAQFADIIRQVRETR